MTQLLSPCLQQAQTQWYSPLAIANMSQHSNKGQSKQDNQEEQKKTTIPHAEKEIYQLNGLFVKLELQC